MTHCSSSSADQAGLIPERVACLDSLYDHIVTENGIKICDKMHFFKGDKQSAWFEAGIQRGGHYCCITCNWSTMGFCDFTRVHHSQLRSYTDIHIATNGVFGIIPNRINFHESLTPDELCRELVSRGIFDFPSAKKGMVEELKKHLCEVQRVPALLLMNPCSDLGDMNLTNYTVLSFEPLHDLKGHIAKLLEQLPSVITNPDTNQKVSHYLKTFFAKPKVYGSDLREALIQVMHILVSSQDQPESPVFILVRTLVKISEIVYSSHKKRCPKQCLQFYNCVFLHHKLYIDLFKPLGLSIYFHSMFIHEPTQHELVCSRSANTEAEERIFKQAMPAAKNTDHKIEGFVEALLVRLQCKHMNSESNSYSLTYKDHSRIKKTSEGLPPYNGSMFSRQFITNHLPAFQSHLERIARFLIPGEGVWWHRDSNHNVHFRDSDTDPKSYVEGQGLRLKNATVLFAHLV